MDGGRTQQSAIGGVSSASSSISVKSFGRSCTQTLSSLSTANPVTPPIFHLFGKGFGQSASTLYFGAFCVCAPRAPNNTKSHRPSARPNAITFLSLLIGPPPLQSFGNSVLTIPVGILIHSKLSGSQCRRRLHLALNFCDLAGAPGYFQIVKILQIEPELGVRMEKSRELQSGLRRNPAAFVHNLTDARSRHMQFQCELVNTQAQRLHEVLPEDFTRVDRRHQRCFRSAHHSFGRISAAWMSTR